MRQSDRLPHNSDAARNRVFRQLARQLLGLRRLLAFGSPAYNPLNSHQGSKL